MATYDWTSSQFETRAIHAGQEPDEKTGAVVVPIYQTSTFAQPSPGQHLGHEYTRTSNPTRDALQEALASLEGGCAAMAFSSGLAATHAVLATLCDAGDDVVAMDDMYGGTFRQFDKVWRRHGLQFRYVDMRETSAVEGVFGPKTKLLWIETPTNPMLKLADITALCERAHKAGVLVAVDNTFATPWGQQPLALGADIVVHSTTKYLGGHSDVVGGAVIVKDPALAARIAFHQNAIGGTPGPFDSWLTLRGVKTLALRMSATAPTRSPSRPSSKPTHACARSSTLACRAIPSTISPNGRCAPAVAWSRSCCRAASMKRVDSSRRCTSSR